jgi:hypothetical protein
LNGIAGTESTGSRTVGTVNRTVIGATWISGGPGLHLNGRLAECAIWNVALTAAEIASLVKAFSPLLIRPASLVAYWPLIGRHDPEICPKGGFDMTLTNTPTTAAHPRIIMPRRAA